MYTWDEAKRAANLEKHGLDFADAGLVYENPSRATFASPRGGEARETAVALVAAAGGFLALVYVERGEDVRCISFRPASRKERKAYDNRKQD